MTDPLVARWPHRLLAELPLARETATRDAATTTAIEAYLSTGREPEQRTVIRL